MHALYLYGSYARGDHRGPASDVDLAVVLDDFDSPGREIDRTAEIRAALSLEYDVVVSIQPIRQSAPSSDLSRLSRILRREGIRVD